MKKCIELNNQAAELIATRDYESAIVHLVDALICSSEMMDQEYEEDDANTSAAMSARARQQKYRLPIHLTLDRTIMAQYPSCVDDKQEKGVHHQTTNMYGRAIPINDTKGDCSLPFNYETHVFVTTIINFNLALAHQLAAAVASANDSKNTSTTSTTRHYLKRAAMLYRIAHKMALEEESESMTLFSMACMNNTGLIYQALGDTKSSRKFFKLLLSTLMLLVVSGGGNNDVFQLDCYFHNTFYLYVSLISAAAA
jgi:hypothetical protein